MAVRRSAGLAGAARSVQSSSRPAGCPAPPRPASLAWSGPGPGRLWMRARARSCAGAPNSFPDGKLGRIRLRVGTHEHQHEDDEHSHAGQVSGVSDVHCWHAICMHDAKSATPRQHVCENTWPCTSVCTLHASIGSSDPLRSLPSGVTLLQRWKLACS